MTESSTRPTRRRAGGGGAGANHQPILDAALAAFAEHGFNGASMRTIASRAGTSLSNLYNYFPSKEDLLAAVLTDANAELLKRVTRTVEASGPTPTDRLRAAVRAYVGFVADLQSASLVALSEFRYLGARRAEVVTARDRTEQLFQQIVEEGASSGDFDVRRTHDTTRAILLLCSTVALWYHPEGQLSREAVAEMQADFATSLVNARR